MMLLTCSDIKPTNLSGLIFLVFSRNFPTENLEPTSKTVICDETV